MLETLSLLGEVPWLVWLLFNLRELHSFKTQLLILRRLKGDQLLMSESEVRRGYFKGSTYPVKGVEQKQKAGYNFLSAYRLHMAKHKNSRPI